MKHLVFAAALCLPLAAHGDGVTFTRGQFTTGTERGAPSDEAALRGARRVVYAFDVANPGAPSQVQLVWRVDGAEAARQSFPVIHTANVRLWGVLPRRPANHAIEVTVLDAAGATLHTDRLAVR